MPITSELRLRNPVRRPPSPSAPPRMADLHSHHNYVAHTTAKHLINDEQPTAVETQDFTDAVVQYHAIANHLGPQDDREPAWMARLKLEMQEMLQASEDRAKQRHRTLKCDLADLKTDLAHVKCDLADLKTDLAHVKCDIADLKIDLAAAFNTEAKNMAKINNSISKIKESMEDIKGALRGIGDAVRLAESP
ncbi:hypothetical protein PSTT_12052 [Puccinia striiformis]|uniref:Uncharacterized protein n=1 Tax=Puccinia striiformis TaxID=27350 RepID=A0A2S4UY06_9BASI|nr:hypothetical protein PSTT_12052 [Puccinia striiformis]